MNTNRSLNESCPYCHSFSTFNFRISKRFYFHCKSCDLFFKGDRQAGDENNLARYYEYKYFADYAHDQIAGTRNVIYSHILDRIENESGIGKILDVGCGCGYFLNEARRRGWNVTGIDPSEESIVYSKTLLGEGVTHKGTLKYLSNDHVYDVITMINVLDHSSEPWADIERSFDLLHSAGLLLLRFPNGVTHSTILKLSKYLRLDNAVVKYLVFHEYLFTPKFITKLLSDYCYVNIKISNANFSRGNIFNSLLKKSYGITVNALSLISGGRIFLAPSLEVTARKK